ITSVTFRLPKVWTPRAGYADIARELAAGRHDSVNGGVNGNESGNSSADGSANANANASASASAHATANASANATANATANANAGAGADSAPGARAIFDAVVRVRRAKLPDPLALGNAGSFFKNPVVGAAQFEALREREPGLVSYPQ